jgi:kinesin family protein 6/9
MIFAEKEARANEFLYSISISYLEIYNDDGYDLLDAEHETKQLSELPKVAMFEDDTGNIHMRNIHLLPANSVDEALNLLFVGDTNRIICETPSNDASSRSHCIFTIYVESREVGGSRIRRSKLHLVDLSGNTHFVVQQLYGSARP